MNKFPIKDILLLTRVISKEAQMLFPDDENSRLQYCAAKGMLAFATKMAHYLRTAKDQNGNLVFPDIFSDEIPQKAVNAQQQCAMILYHSQSVLLEDFNTKYPRNSPKDTPLS